jgi:diaminopimelate decarboxylase
MLKITSSKVTFSDIDIIRLAEKLSTPFFLFSQKTLENNYKEFYKAFSSQYKNIRIDFSVKTDNEISVLKILKNLGSHGEIVAGYELKLAQKAGFSVSDLTYDGPCKSDTDIALAIKEGIHAIYADSAGELSRISRIAKKLKKTAPVGLRINLGLKSILSGPAETAIGKFGIPLKGALLTMVEASQLPNLKIMAISTHIGSQITSVEPYLKAVEKMCGLLKDCITVGLPIEEVCLGGGFPSQSLNKVTLPGFLLSSLGIVYQTTLPSLADYGSQIGSAFSGFLRRNNMSNVQLVFQPGRSISSSMGIMISTVRVVKDKWIFLDTSTSTLPESIFFAQRKMLVANKINQPPFQKYNVAGKGLNSSDNFAYNLPLPRMEVGDKVIILDAGAYSISRANRFTVLNPAIYMIKNNGKIIKVRREEEYGDVLRPMEF